MVDRKSRTGDNVPCDYCNEQIAVLFCRADSAKLCLYCDQHVHSANALSHKHVRSQICDNCGSEPVSVRCSTDNLLLCQDCDWDAHGSSSVSAAHDRNPVDGFTGCPSAPELASAWGVDLEDVGKKAKSGGRSVADWSFQDLDGGFDSWLNKSVQDLMVPSGNSSLFYSNGDCAETKKQNSSCGKQKQAIIKQLMGLFKREGVEFDDKSGGGDGGGGSADDGQNQNQTDWGSNAQSLPDQQQTPFTSLLMMDIGRQIDLENCDQIVEGNVSWDNTSNNRGTQIWDFGLGKLRDHEESSPLEVGYGGNDGGFMMKTFGELLKEESLENTQGLGDSCGMKSNTTHEYATVLKDNQNSAGPSKGSATSETSNLPKAKPSGSACGNPKSSFGLSKDIQFTDNTDLMIGETARTASKADMELLARNRNNAMIRYKEKKKNRRYDKHIRYESRKARADTRKRVKGRFVKASTPPDG